MRDRLFALGLALLFTLAQTAPALAATPKPSADWASVQALSTGEKVAVITNDGDRLKGRFGSATDTDIIFTHEGSKVTLRRDSIKRVEVGRKKRLAGALVGAGLGGGAGRASARPPASRRGPRARRCARRGSGRPRPLS